LGINWLIAPGVSCPIETNIHADKTPFYCSPMTIILLYCL